MTTRAEAIAAAGRALAEARALADSLPPEEAARLAWTPTSPYTVDQLAEQIRASRAARAHQASRMPRTPHAGSGDTAPAGPHGGGTGRGATKTA